MKMVYHICKALWELKKSTGKLKVVFANWNSIFFLSEILTCLYCLPLFNWCHLFLLDCNGSSWLKRPDRSYWNMKLSKLQRLAFFFPPVYYLLCPVLVSLSVHNVLSRPLLCLIFFLFSSETFGRSTVRYGCELWHSAFITLHLLTVSCWVSLMGAIINISLVIFADPFSAG